MDGVAASALDKNNIADIIPLTPMQQGMLFHDLMEREQRTGQAFSAHSTDGGGARSYFQQMDFRINGPLDKDALEYAWQALINRHSVLRSVFKHDKAKEPIQIVLKEREFHIQFLDFSGLDPNHREQSKRQLIVKDREAHFDLERDVLLRVTLIRYSPEAHWVIWSFHHILMDGWCTAILQRELFHHYHNFRRLPLASQLPPPPEYRNYVEWYRQQDSYLHFWQEYLRGYKESVSLPLPAPVTHSQIQSRDGPSDDSVPRHDSIELTFDKELTQKMTQLGQNYAASISTVFHALWGVYLGKLNRVDDVVFGSVQSIRPNAIANVEDLIGLCINTLPCRIRFSRRDSFATLLSRVQSEMLDCLEHGVTSLSEIQSQLDTPAKLCTHFLAFENYPSAQRIGGERLTEELWSDEMSVFMPTAYNFHLAAYAGDCLSVTFKFNPRHVATSSVDLMAQRFHCLCQRILQQPMQELASWALLTDEEIDSQLGQWARGRDVVPDSLLSRLSKNVFEHGTRPALTQGNSSFTHTEFDNLSTSLAHRLLCAGVDRSADSGGIVLLGSACPELLIAVFACLKLGVPFIPVDPTNPARRIEHILSCALPQLIVVTGADRYLELNTQTPRLELDLSVLRQGEIGLTDWPLHSLTQAGIDPVAYIIFTSGTSGAPKGVPIRQSALANYLHWISDTFGLGPEDSSLLLTSFSFDLGYTAIFGSLALGGHLHLAGEDQRRDPQWVSNYLSDAAIRFIKTTPSYLHMLLQSVPVEQLIGRSSLHTIICGGEELIFGDLQRIEHQRPEIKLYNHYGPTEATIGCCAKKLASADLQGNAEQVIGRPSHNTLVCISDGNGIPLPANVIGELMIAGPQLSEGYLDPILSDRKQGAEGGSGDNRFITPGWLAGGRLYKTGDRAYWREDGQVVFLGRDQNFCKIDGYRIDVRSIEATLRLCPWLKDALVTSTHTSTGADVLLALVIHEPSYQPRPGVGALRNWLAERLPRYMLPGEYLEVSRFPLTDNGKIDAAELAQYRARYQTLAANTGPAEPVTPLQKQLQGIWRDVLFRDVVGIDDDFFHLGGHSIKAILCLARIKKTIGCEIGINTIFTYTTIRQLAQVIEQLANRQEAQDNSLLTLASATHPRFSLYMLPPALGTSTVYKEMLQELPFDVEAFGFQCGGFSSSDAVDASIEEMANRAAAQIRDHYQSKRLGKHAMLVGYSMGGIVALECALILQQQNIVLPLLLLDCSLDGGPEEISYQMDSLKGHANWHKIISILQTNLSADELEKIESGAKRHQELLDAYRLRLGERWRQVRLHSPIAAIEAVGNKNDSNMHNMACLTENGFRLLKTQGNHFTMFHPPYFNGLVEHITELIPSLVGEQGYNSLQSDAAESERSRTTYAQKVS